jgi:hypothetical protein
MGMCSTITRRVVAVPGRPERAALDARGAERGPAQVPVQVGVADVESEGPGRAAGGGLVDRLPVRGAFVAFLCVCTSVPALSWGQYRHDESRYTNTHTHRGAQACRACLRLMR